MKFVELITEQSYDYDDYKALKRNYDIEREYRPNLPPFEDEYGDIPDLTFEEGLEDFKDYLNYLFAEDGYDWFIYGHHGYGMFSDDDFHIVDLNSDDDIRELVAFLNDMVAVGDDDNSFKFFGGSVICAGR